MEELQLTSEQLARRADQDEKWRDASIDGRAHVSHRELTAAYGSQFQKAIAEYNFVDEMVSMHQNNVKPWCLFTLDTLERIVGFTMYGNDALVFECARRRKLYSFFRIPSSLDESPFRICVRKRPLLQFELEDNEYDVVHTMPKEKKPTNSSSKSSNKAAEEGTIVMHDGKLSRNGRRLSMTHRSYIVHEIWGADSTNDDVCRRSVQPLLDGALTGTSGTLIMFGQTGTGKTYTLNAALDFLASRLNGTEVELVFYEIHGKKSYDLLNERRSIALRTDAEGQVHPRGVRIVTCRSAEEIHTCVAGAMALRSSRITERNPISSRSHAICQIRIPSAASSAGAASTSHHSSPSSSSSSPPSKLALGTLAATAAGVAAIEAMNATSTASIISSLSSSSSSAAAAAEAARVPVLTLVDLAGSERNYETVKMTAAMHKESADINFSLMALKDCFRAFHEREKSNVKVATTTDGDGAELAMRPSSAETPNDAASSASTSKTAKPTMINFRAHLLTRVLQGCFRDEGHKTCIVVTVSPTPTDLYHSLNSLDHALKMCPELHAAARDVTCEIPLANMPSATVPVTEWSAAQVQTWLATVDNGRFAALALPQNLDGAALMAMNSSDLSALFAGELRRARVEDEGAAWVVSTDGARQQTAIGRAFWGALHREQRRALAKAAVLDDAIVNQRFMEANGAT